MTDIPWTRSGQSLRQMWQAQLDQLEVKAQYVPDMLATMMSQQERHMEVYEKKSTFGLLTLPFDSSLCGQWERREVHESFRRTMNACVEEIMEAVGLFKAKPWKRTFHEPDRAAVLDEIGDAMHFFLEACLVLGLSPEDLFRAYFKTSDKNVARQNGNY